MKPVPMPSVCVKLDKKGIPCGTKVIWNGRIYDTQEEAMNDRHKHITKLLEMGYEIEYP